MSQPSATDALDRWERYGGTWRIRSLSADAVEIDLCTCTGEPVERLGSSDPAFVTRVAARRQHALSTEGRSTTSSD